MTNRRIDNQEYQLDAFGNTKNKKEHAGFMMELASVASRGKMEEFTEILNPNSPNPDFGLEGWYIKRKVESVEEINKRIDELRERFPKRKNDLLGYVDTDAELPEWPGNARFKLRIDPEIWSNSNGQCDYYYDSKTMKELVAPLAESYRKFNPDKGGLVEDMLRYLDYWVELDTL